MNKVLIAKICGSTFAAISIYCSALLWWSFAEGATDQVIAAAIGAGFVACQYLFHANGNYITTAVLFAISAAATVGWIESRYDSLKTTELSSDSSYAEKTKTLTELNNTLALQNLSAKNDLANTSINFTGRANRTLIQAKQTQSAIMRLEKEIKHLKNANPSSQKSGSAIANKLSEWRWGLWAMLAAMIDTIPMICFSIVSKSNEDNVSGNVTETIQDNQSTSPQPAQQQDATILRIIENDDLTETISSEIAANVYGDKPSLRNVMKQHSLRHERTKHIFEQLVQMGTLQPQGNRFIRTQINAEKSTQEQPA